MKTVTISLLIAITFFCATNSYSKLLAPPMKKCPQHMSSWCWAGTAEAILTYYGVDVGNDSCAHVITTANQGQPLNVITKIVNKFYPAAAAVTSNGKKPTEADAKAEADKGAPFGMFWPGHFVAYAGYEGDKHLVMNPWPPGTDTSAKAGAWQTLTFAAVLNANGKGTWGGLVTTKGKLITDINTLQNKVATNNSLRIVTSASGLKTQSIQVALPEGINSEGDLMFYTVKGNVLYSTHVQSGIKSLAVDVSSFSISNGLYFVKYLNSNNQLYTAKLYITR